MQEKHQQDHREQGTRAHERRWRDAWILSCGTGNGGLWKYGSIALAVMLTGIAWLLLTFSM